MNAKVVFLTAGVAGVLLAGLVAALLVLSPSDHAARSTASPVQDRAHTAPPTVRTLIVTRGRREPPPSRPGATMHALLLEGKLPSRPTMATVTSDEDCAPDAAGISHCLNRLRLEGAGKLAVRHPHAMSQVPCMTPGERVRVVRG